MITWSYFWAIENYQLNNRIFLYFSQAIRWLSIQPSENIPINKFWEKVKEQVRRRLDKGFDKEANPSLHLCSGLTSKCRYQTFFRVSLGQNRNQNRWISVCQQKFGFMYGVLLILIPVRKNVPLFPKDGLMKFEIQQDYLEKWFWDLKIEVLKK